MQQQCASKPAELNEGQSDHAFYMQLFTVMIFKVRFSW